MEWFYAVNGEQLGPVDPAELKRLRDTGVIGDQSLVWREGMTNWQPYREVQNLTAAPIASGAVAGPGILCSECGRSFRPDEVVRLADAFVCATCKPIRLQKMSEGVTDNSAETIRKEHIKHEASIKSVGFLYFLGAAFMALAGLGQTLGTRGEGAIIGVIFFAFSAGLIVAAVGIRSLKPWARIVSGVLSGIGLLGFPLGTLINAYILYLLFSKKGSLIFSEEYQGIIAATPHVKYRTSIVVWILVGLLLLLALVAVFGWLSSTMMRH